MGSVVGLFGCGGPAVEDREGVRAEVGQDPGVWVRFVRFAGDDLVEGEGFEGAVVIEAPVGGGELLDEELLVGRRGFEFGVVAFEQTVEGGLIGVAHFAFRVAAGVCGTVGSKTAVCALRGCGAVS